MGPGGLARVRQCVKGGMLVWVPTTHQSTFSFNCSEEGQTYPKPLAISVIVVILHFDKSNKIKKTIFWKQFQPSLEVLKRLTQTQSCFQVHFKVEKQMTFCF